MRMTLSLGLRRSIAGIPTPSGQVSGDAFSIRKPAADLSLHEGGDDLKLKGWDLRQGCDQPTFVNKRSFEGGVTTIQSHPLLENIFAVGR